MASTEWPPQASGPRITPAGWQCPGCRVFYSPEVRECHCEADARSLSDRIARQPPLRLGGGAIGIPPEVVMQA